MAKAKESSFKRIGESETWEKGQKASVATVLERKDGVKGISIKIGKKVPYQSRPRYGKTIWIDEELDLPSWLNWFIRTIKNMYLKVFGKRVTGIDEESEYYRTRTEQLTKELAETQRKLEESEQKQISNKHIVSLAQKSIENLDNYQTVFNEFKSNINESLDKGVGFEEKIKTKIMDNRWLLGLECQVEAKNENVDKQTQIDLHVKTKYNQDRIFEVKSPNIKPVIRKDNKEKRRFIISPDLADGLSELILYMRRTDIYSQHKNEGLYGIQKASGCILIGYNLSDSELELLKELNFHLGPHIQIVTYNDLIKNIESEMTIIKTVKEEITKQ